MRPLRYVLLAIAAAGCTLVVGSDPQVGGEDASTDARDSGTAPESGVESSTKEASTCDAGGCYAAKDACKKKCAAAASACNAACNQDDSKTCKKLCAQQLSACNDVCVSACDVCVSGCAAPCAL